MSETKDWIFAYAVHPVQAFIEKARKTQDLWGASMIVAELASRVWARMRRSAEVEMKFPQELPGGDRVALIPHEGIGYCRGDRAGIEALLQEARESMDAAWEEIREDVLRDLPDIFPAHAKEAGKKSCFRLVHAACPASRDFRKDFAEVGRILAAVKNTRVFEQRASFGGGRTCSLCGEEEQLPYNWKAVSAKYPERFKKTEGLCPVCLVKRYYALREKSSEPIQRAFINGLCETLRNGRPEEKAEPYRFPSISSIAVGHYKFEVQGYFRGLEKQKDRGEKQEEELAAYRRFLEDFRELKEKAKIGFHEAAVPCLEEAVERASVGRDFLRSDGQWLYPETWTEEKLEDEGVKGVSESERRRFRGVVAGFWRDLAPLATSVRNPKYYMALLMDGDGIGKAMRESEKPEELSRRLCEFGGKVRGIVEDRHRGKLVYTGGDDLMAFLPLATALDCAIDLRREFHETVNAGGSGNEGSITVSGALTCAHVRENLRGVIRTTRETLREAKQERDWLPVQPNKIRGNALGITIAKRSGPQDRFFLPWSGRNWGIPGESEPPKVLRELAEVFAGDVVSPRFVHHLGQRFAFVGESESKRIHPALASIPADPASPEAFGTPLAMEILVGVRRQWEKNSEKEGKEKEQGEIQRRMVTLYYSSLSWTEFLKALQTATFLAGRVQDE